MDTVQALAALLFTLAAAGFATALLAARGAGGPAPARRALLAAAYAGLGMAALIGTWRVWGPGFGAAADPQPASAQRTLVVFSLILLVALVAALAWTDAARRGRKLWRRNRRAVHDVEQIRQEMQRFTAATAHDLKSPLRSIYGHATLLERRLDADVDREILENIKNSARRMTTMVDELLRYTKVADSAPVVKEVRFLQLAEAVEAELQQTINDRMASVEWRGGGMLHADPTLMNRALHNLIENAIKYGPEGGHVVVRAEPFLGGLRITVEDEGPGVPENERERIFEVFQRGTTGLDVPGTGIGLATVAKVAQLHSGSVGVESAEGQGSRFWLWIPGPTDPNRKHMPSVEPIVGNLPVMG